MMGYRLDFTGKKMVNRSAMPQAGIEAVRILSGK
jgi:hypothetical protein